MSARPSTGLAAAVALYEQLRRRPDPEATASQLHPGRLDPPTRWTPDLLALTPYASVDPATLELEGYPDFHAIPDQVLDAAIDQVVQTEGPVHFDVLADRLLNAAAVGRLGSRIRARIEARVEQRQTAWLAGPAQWHQPRYRDWREAPAATRQLDYVSDPELMLALFRAVLDGRGEDRDTVMNNGIHAIGFTRLTAAARARLEGPLEALIQGEYLVATGDTLRVAQTAL